MKIRKQKCTVFKEEEDLLNCSKKTRGININLIIFKSKFIEGKEINKGDERKGTLKINNKIKEYYLNLFRRKNFLSFNNVT